MAVPNPLGRLADAAKAWADGHRELVIIGVALPMGTVATAVDKVRNLFAKPIAASGHDRRVARVIAEVRRYAAARSRGEGWAQKPLRTDRKGAASLNTRMSDKSCAETVQMHDLKAILDVDEARSVVRVEPFVTVGEVAEHLDQRGLQLEATIEMKDATLGGLVMALGMTTHSHICGLVHDTVTAEVGRDVSSGSTPGSGDLACRPFFLERDFRVRVQFAIERDELAQLAVNPG